MSTEGGEAPPDADVPHRAASALRSRNVRLLVAGQSLSMLSYGAYFTVLAWFAYDTGGGPGAAGVVLGAVALSSVATLLLGGALADRWDRRRMMVVSDLGRGCVLAIFACLALVERLDLWVLTALVVLLGLFDGLFARAFGALIPRLVPEALLGPTNAVLGLVRSVCTIGGPVLGGVTYAWLGMGAICVLTSAAFVVAAGTAVALRPSSGRQASGPTMPLRDSLDGLRYVCQVPLLVSIPVAALALLISEAPTQVLLPQLVSERYHSDSGGFGALNTALGLGAALGALIYARTLPRRRRAVLVYTCWTCAHIMFALIAWVETVPVAVVLGVISGTLTGFGLAWPCGTPS